MATPYITGPAHIYVLLPHTSTFAYLGTAERYPKISIRPAGEPVFNDIGGKVPFDMAYMGEEAFVSADISRWNEATYAAMASRPSHSAGPVRGFNGPLDVGTLYIAEGLAYQLVVQFPYGLGQPFAKGAYTANDMPGGYHFYASYLVGPDELEPLGTTPRKIRLIWHCLRVYNPATQSFLLYDNTLTGITLTPN